MSDIRFIFDVDGTLTPSRQLIDSEFGDFFLTFCTNNSVSLVSGSDYEKTLEQLGDKICASVDYIFSCSGNSVRNNLNNTVQTRHLDYMPYLETRLKQLLRLSAFPVRSGNHIEDRPGGINFSIVGRNASLSERKQYIDYDKKRNERRTIAAILTAEFPYLEFTVGGETGIDIVAAGCNKAQITSYFNKQDTLYFFGDCTTKGGNDYPLARTITDNNLGKVYPVTSWRDTYQLLLKI